jgi:hypothetical protein
MGTRSCGGDVFVELGWVQKWRELKREPLDSRDDPV